MRQMKQLTRDQLLKVGVVSVNWLEDENDWEVIRMWYKNKSKKKRLTKKRCQVTGQKHKYAPDGEYNIMILSAKQDTIRTTIARIVYAWYFGEVPENYSVGFIDDSRPDKYALDNLKLVSKEEIERHKNKGNQYYSTKWNIIAKKYEDSNE